MDRRGSFLDGTQEALVRNISGVWGDEGRDWLAHLPQLLAEYEQRWQITILPPFANLSFNYVAPALRSDGTPAVFKAGVPHAELVTEVAALQFLNGDGIVRLLESDRDHGVLLIERVQPGTMLSTLADDEQATAIAANILRQLWRPAPADHVFPDLTRWLQSLWEITDQFDGTTGPLPHELVITAQQLGRDLIQSQGPPMLLHGDFHHYNVLQAERQPWLAIDPKGIVGDPYFDLGAFLLNPWPKLLDMPQPDRVLARRVDQFADALELDRDRVAAWGFTTAVLSSCWTLEGFGDPNYSVAVAQLLRDLIR